MSVFAGVFHLLFIFLALSLSLSNHLINIDYFSWGPTSFGFLMLFDFYSFSFARFIMLISSVVFFYSFFYVRDGLDSVRFLSIVFLFVGSILILVFFPSILGMILGWDGLGVTSFLLVIFYNNVSSLRSGLLTIYVNRLGDLFFIFSFFFMIMGGLFRVDFFLIDFPILFCFFLMGAGITKRAQMPFSAWLPAAISAPTPVSSLVHSSTLVTAGVYLFIRFYYIFSHIFIWKAFLCVSLLTFFSARLLACVENDLKKLVAISTLSQLGLMIFSFYLGNFFITFFHIVSHALFKSLLFLTCGFVILTSFSSQDIRLMGRRVMMGKPIFFMLYVSVLRIIGLFFLRGFFSKDLIVDIVFRLDISLGQFFLFTLSCVLSVLYRMKIIYESLMGFQSSFSLVAHVYLKGSIVLMLFLFFWSIFFGKIFFLFFFDGELAPKLVWEKLMGGVFLVLSFFLLRLGIKFGGFAFFQRMFFESFFLNWFFGGFFSRKPFLVGILLVGESYWLEALGAKGLTFFFLRVFSFFSSRGNFFISSIFIFIIATLFVFALPVSL